MISAEFEHKSLLASTGFRRRDITLKGRQFITCFGRGSVLSWHTLDHEEASDLHASPDCYTCSSRSITGGLRNHQRGDAFNQGSLD